MQGDIDGALIVASIARFRCRSLEKVCSTACRSALEIEADRIDRRARSGLGLAGGRPGPWSACRPGGSGWRHATGRRLPRDRSRGVSERRDWIVDRLVEDDRQVVAVLRGLDAIEWCASSRW